MHKPMWTGFPWSTEDVLISGSLSMSTAARLFAPALALALAGCATLESSPATTAPAEDTVEVDEHPPGPLHPDTFLVEDHDCFVAVVTHDRNAVLDFEFSCAAQDVDGLEVGRVVMGAEDGGYLVRIEALAFDGRFATAWTSPATLSEALTDVHIVESVVLDDGSRDVLDFSGRELMAPGSDGPGSVLVERGLLTVNPKMDLDVDIRWLSLRAATATLTVGLNFDVQTLMEATGAVDHEGTINLGRTEYPFEIDVGPTTVVGRVDMVMHLRFEHEAAGAASDRFGFTGGGRVVLGGRWEKEDDSWTQIWEPRFTGEIGDQDVSGDDHVGRVSVIIEATLEMDKMEGSNFRWEPWSTGDVMSDCDGLSHVSAGGIEGRSELHLGFFDDGPRVDRSPRLDITAARGEGWDTHATPPAGCSDEPPEPPAATCAPVAQVECGQPFEGDTATDPDVTTALDGYDVAVGNYDAPELTWSFVALETGPVEVAFVDPEPTEVNHDLFVLDGGAGVCAAAEAVAFGFNSVVFDAVAGHTYFFVVDGFDDHAGAFEATVDCGP